MAIEPTVIPADPTAAINSALGVVVDIGGENAVRILALEAGASVAYADWDSAQVDIFNDSTGFGDTVDTVETTATYGTEQYQNYAEASQEWTDAASSRQTVTSSTTTFTTTKQGYISNVAVEGESNSGNIVVSIVQGGDTLASKTVANDAGTDFNIAFAESDYSALIAVGTFSIEVNSSNHRVTASTVSGSSGVVSWTSQNIPMTLSASNETAFISYDAPTESEVYIDLDANGATDFGVYLRGSGEPYLSDGTNEIAATVGEFTTPSFTPDRLLIRYPNTSRMATSAYVVMLK